MVCLSGFWAGEAQVPVMMKEESRIPKRIKHISVANLRILPSKGYSSCDKLQTCLPFLPRRPPCHDWSIPRVRDQ